MILALQINYRPDLLKKTIHGFFNIEINKVKADGSPLEPPSSSSGHSSGRKGPAPLPFAEKGDKAQGDEARKFAQGHDANLLFRAASYQMKFVNKDKAYVMKKMRTKPQAASTFRHLYKNKNKKKG